MKSSILGLGIFALIFSLNLFFSGSVETKKASPESLYSQFDGASQQEVLSDSGEITPHDGILQHKTETSELHHVARKYPAVLGLLFYLLNQHIEQNQDHLFAASYSFSPTKDLPLSYHNLRI